MLFKKSTGKAPETSRRRRVAMLVFFAFVGLAGSSHVIAAPAYAQTSSSSTMDMTPLIGVIIGIIPLFIVISLLDKIMGKVRG